MHEDLSDEELQALIDKAADRSVFGGKLAYGSAIQYTILTSMQEERKAKNSNKKHQRVFTYELPSF
jgi:hypothetical protein